MTPYDRLSILFRPSDYQVTEEQVRELGQMFAEKNLDMVKIYYRLSPLAYGWVMDETEEQGLVAGGHIKQINRPTDS